MTCHLCSGPIVIKTDPEHRDYAVVSGAIRKTEDYSARDARVIELPDDKQKKKLESDPLYKLEHVSADKKVAVDKSDTLGELIGMRSEQFEDDYAASRLMRSVFRKRKAEEIAVEKSNKEKVNCLFCSGISWLICFFSQGIHVKLQEEEHEDDVLLAKSTKFAKKKPAIVKLLTKKQSSIFNK